MLETLQTIVHEMCHLWQAHFGSPGRGRYHNAQWADKMEAIGLMPSTTGRPGGARVGDHMADYMIPGGRFEHAVQHLVTGRGFSISWYDRQVAPTPLYESTSAAEAVALPASILTTPSLLIASQRTGTAAKDRSNRLRYACPGCQIKTWGKPGLRLICEPCNQRLAPSDTAMT